MLNRGSLSWCKYHGDACMFTLKITRHFTIEIENGIYLKVGNRELFWSREMGLSRE